MSSPADLQTGAGAVSASGLQSIGAIGAALALIILGASMLLRLTTIFGAEGEAISTLPVAVENATRLAHRLAAAGVGLLALWAVILCWKRRPLPETILRPIGWFVAATIFLSIIGPLTPGYRHEAVTIGNVLGGMLLLMAFWWLVESVGAVSSMHKNIEPLLRAGIFVFLLHVATGAAASAFEMRGIRWFAFLHVGTALLATMFIGAALWDRRAEALTGWRATTGGILATQLVLGFCLIGLGTRPVWLSFIHGMLSPMLGVALVSLAIRSQFSSHPLKQWSGNDA